MAEPPKSRLDPESEKLLGLVVDQEIADRCGVSRERVRQWRVVRGIPPFTETRRDLLREAMEAPGRPRTAEIAREFGIHPTALDSAARRHGWRPSPVPRKKRAAPRTEQAAALRALGLTWAEVSRRMGIRAAITLVHKKPGLFAQANAACAEARRGEVRGG